jgi:hypothetical protein
LLLNLLIFIKGKNPKRKRRKLTLWKSNLKSKFWQKNNKLVDKPEQEYQDIP